MRGILRRRVVPALLAGPALLLAGLALLLAGCDEDASADPGRALQWPAGAAGMACQLLEYDFVAAGIGTRFDTAGGARQDDTYTCVLTQAGQEYPDLTLAMTSSTADEVIFTATITPSGTTAVTDLGRIAYQVGIAAAAPRGSGVEIGWLSASGRLMIVRYSFPATATPAEVDELTPRLVALARQIDQAFATPRFPTPAPI